MANFISCGRTNYFHVKDMDVFENIISRAMSEDAVTVIHSDSAPSMVGFIAPGGIYGLYPENYDKDDDIEACEEDLMDAIQKVVADDDACIYTEIGHENMRYVSGGVYVITSKEVVYHDITNIGKKVARDMLGDPEWDTETTY